MGGGGKGTFSEVIEGIIGPENVAQVRTKHLGERFELGGYIGKTLLCGRDVGGAFLNEKGAAVLKALTGGDRLDVELKNGNDRSFIVGGYNVAVTTNARLRVRLDGDGSAWSRRIVIIPFTRTTDIVPIPNFPQVLLRDEGPGILNWMLDGAMRLLDELKKSGALRMTCTQKTRVRDLLCESDSVRDFVNSRVELAEGCDLTTAELVESYRGFCFTRGWTPLPGHTVMSQIADAMADIYKRPVATDLIRDGGYKRGYRGVRLKNLGSEQ